MEQGGRESNGLVALPPRSELVAGGPGAAHPPLEADRGPEGRGGAGRGGMGTASAGGGWATAAAGWAAAAAVALGPPAPAVRAHPSPLGPPQGPRLLRP